MEKKKKIAFITLYISILTALILLGFLFLPIGSFIRRIYFLLLGASLGSGKYKKFILYITDPYYGIDKE